MHIYNKNNSGKSGISFLSYISLKLLKRRTAGPFAKRYRATALLPTELIRHFSIRNSKVQARLQNVPRTSRAAVGADVSATRPSRLVHALA